jgi:hypothetical protein
MTESCQQYLQNPEANTSHLAECEECRRMTEALMEPRLQPGATEVRLESLPLAPWEGAGHRSWPLVLGSALTVIAIAAAFFAAAGVTPIDVFRHNAPSLDMAASIIRLVQNAPATFHIVVIGSFLVVNALLMLLLRRAPRGIDV